MSDLVKKIADTLIAYDLMADVYAYKSYKIIDNCPIKEVSDSLWHPFTIRFSVWLERYKGLRAKDICRRRDCSGYCESDDCVSYESLVKEFKDWCKLYKIRGVLNIEKGGVKFETCCR